MAEENRKNAKRYGLIAAGVIAVLAVVFGAYQMGRSVGPGEDIGEETAKSIALDHAAVAEGDLSSYGIARDEAGGSPVYEVEFTADSCDYTYVVSAATGTIVKFSREQEDGAVPPPAAQDAGAPAPADSRIGEDQAWEIAYGHAGLTAADVSPSPAKLDYDDGVLVYELEFFSGGYEYDYEINAADGSVVKFEKEADTASQPVQSKPAAPAAGTSGGSAGSSTPASGAVSASGGSSAPQGGGAKSDIGEARAKEIALAHAGVSADSVSNYKWELDYDGGISVYELEFVSGGYEYDYEINAADGSVVKFEKEVLDGYAAQGTLTADAVSYIGEARAREIAYGHACLTADAVAHCGVELDHHDSHHGGHGSHHRAGCCTYEVDFRSGGYEYEYEIDAVTGEILGFEQETAD